MDSYLRIREIPHIWRCFGFDPTERRIAIAQGEEKALTSKPRILDSQCNEEAGAASEHSLSTFCQTFPRMKECHVLVAAAGGAGVGREEIFFGEGRRGKSFE